MSGKKIIFITNDDGYVSKGFIDLRNALSKIARVIAVAPAHEKSACGHGLSVAKTLELIEIQKDFYKLDDGNPSDCIYVGMRKLFNFNTLNANIESNNAKILTFSKKNSKINNIESNVKNSTKLPLKPDLIISGINIGSNMGEDTTYSGTVAGAMEGAIHGIPSIAISQFITDDFSEDFKTADRDFSLATSFIVNLAKDILKGKYEIGHRKYLNVNVPPLSIEKCKGVKVTQLGYRHFNGTLSSFLSPRKHTFDYLGMNPFKYSERENSDNAYFSGENGLDSLDIISDFSALHNGYISVTPMQLDLTSYNDIISLNKLFK